MCQAWIHLEKAAIWAEASCCLCWAWHCLVGGTMWAEASFRLCGGFGATGRGTGQASMFTGVGSQKMLEQGEWCELDQWRTTDFVSACPWPAGWVESSTKEQWCLSVLPFLDSVPTNPWPSSPCPKVSQFNFSPYDQTSQTTASELELQTSDFVLKPFKNRILVSDFPFTLSEVMSSSDHISRCSKPDVMGTPSTSALGWGT